MRPVWACTLGLLLATGPAGAAGLADVAGVSDRTSHRASSYDRTGGNEDSLISFAPGETHVLLDTGGPGRITHVWMTIAGFPGNQSMTRDVILRMYWENAPVPSVEVPLGDFFGMGHGRHYAYQSVPMAVGAHPLAMNCYWPMPFYKHARIEVFNAGSRSIRRLYYNISYELGDIPAGQGLFHALYRRDRAVAAQPHEGNTTGAENYVILETEGRGQYVGCTLAVDAQPGGWWGEGDEMIFIDHAEVPTIMGTGSEDYFCNAWGYDDAFSYPFYGAPLLENRDDGSKLAVVYRWHVPDPIHFKKHIRVTIETLWRAHLLNDFTTVAYWYQTEPMKSRPPLPAAELNQPGAAMSHVDATSLESDCLDRGIKARALTTALDQGYSRGGWLKIETGGQPVDLHIPVPRPGTYRLQVKPVNHLVEGAIRLTLEGGETRDFRKLPPERGERSVPFVSLGQAAAAQGFLKVTVSGNPIIGLDEFRIVQVTGSEAYSQK
jgi:hypothetical protein